MIDVILLHPEFGAEIRGVAIGGGPSAVEFAAIERALNRYSVLLFREQTLDDDGHLAFTRRFGEPEESHVDYYSHGRIGYIGRIGNVDAEGHQLPSRHRGVHSQTGNEMWHSDSSFREIPSLYSLNVAYEVPPEDGDTEFVSARAAYARLDPATRERVDPLVGIHDYIYSRTKVGEDAVSEGQRTYMRPVRQRLVRRNPVTGEKNLYLGSHVRGIDGWPDDEARPLLERLTEETVRPESIYRHRWRAGDLLMWDNRCVLHRGCGYDADRFRRRLHQTRVRCTGPSLAESC